MAIVTPYWWPRRRVDLTVEQIGYEAATPPDWLQDDAAAELALIQERERAERQCVRWIRAIALTALGLWYFGWLA